MVPIWHRHRAASTHRLHWLRQSDSQSFRSPRNDDVSAAAPRAVPLAAGGKRNSKPTDIAAAGAPQLDTLAAGAIDLAAAIQILGDKPRRLVALSLFPKRQHN